MGMFDYVNFKMPCPECGHEIRDFQSKDGECYMETLELSEVFRFYGSCDKCNLWVEFNRRPGSVVIGDFDMNVRRIGG